MKERSTKINTSAANNTSDRQQSTSAEMSLQGPTDQNYDMNKSVGVTSWSPCGDFSAIMNVNSEIRIAPITTTKKGIMTVCCGVHTGIRWRFCDGGGDGDDDEPPASSSTTTTTSETTLTTSGTPFADSLLG